MTEGDRKQPVVLSRDELYQKVWATPMRQLATTYGITGTGLAKICARLKVPCPPRGYWAKKAAGKPVVQFRLPEPEADTPQKVTITPAAPPEQPSKAQAEVQQQVERARSQHSNITVPARLAKPHPVIAKWLAEHERQKQDALRERDPLIRQMRKPKPFTELDRREHRFLDALFKALEPLGFAIKAGEYHRVHFEFEGEKIEYQLREKQKQVRVPLTDDEKRWYGDRDWKQQMQPTGLLMFVIKSWLGREFQTEWREKPDAPLENDLPAIVATLSLAGPYLVKQRQERLEEEKRHREAEHKRYTERREREQDHARWLKFVAYARQGDEAASVRRLLAELKAQPQPDSQIGGHSSEEWFAWADAWLEDHDPVLLGTERILTSLIHVEAPFKPGY